MSYKLETELETEIGTLLVTFTYEISHGSLGDYHHPSEPPSVYLIDTKIEMDKPDEHVIEEIIEDHERNKYDPEDFYERG